VIFTACPKCERTDFPSRAARDSHVYRCKKNSKSCSPKSIRAEPISQSQNSEHISHPFSDEWRCEKCLHRFTSLESAEEHYQKRHVEKIPYKTEPKEKEIPQVEQALSTQDLLNQLARQRAEELMRSRFAPQEGIVKQQLYSLPEPQVEPREQESETRPNNEIDSKPQSPVIINALKSLLRSKGKMKVDKEPQPELTQIYMASRGIGVDGVNVAFNPKPNYCRDCEEWIYDFQVKQHTDLGHVVVRQG
jgi:hypothetical protein